MLIRDKEGRCAPGGHVTRGCFSGTVISVLNKVKGGSGAGLCPAPATAPNPVLLGWTTGEATLPGNLDVLLAGLGCRLTFSRSGCRDGQQLKGNVQALPLPGLAIRMSTTSSSCFCRLRGNAETASKVLRARPTGPLRVAG